MISIALGLLVLGALTALFINSSSVRRELDKVSEALESGRYGLNVLNDELSHAGFYGTLSAPSGTTDSPCSTTVAQWGTSLAIPARGSNNNKDEFDCIKDLRKEDTDAVFIQRASTCIANEAGCDALAAGVAYLQVSECGDEYSTTPYVLAANSGTPPFSLRKKKAGGGCDVAGSAPIRKHIRRIFFVDTDNVLQRVDIANGSVGTPVSIASNIENMQIEYGVDNNDDGSPDEFSSSPGDWTKVIGARVWLLSRSSAPTPGYQDDKDYAMGDWTWPSAARAAGDKPYKRHVFSSYISFTTPQGTRE